MGSAVGAAGTTPRRNPVIGVFLAVERVLGNAVSVAACLCLVLAAASGFHQVITRFLLAQPSDWTETLTRTLLIWMVYLGIMAAFRQGAMVSVDLALRLAQGWIAVALRTLITLACIALLAVIAWFGWEMMLRVQYQNLSGLEVSIAWAYAALPVGASLTILAVLANWLDPQNRELENAQ